MGWHKLLRYNEGHEAYHILRLFAAKPEFLEIAERAASAPYFWGSAAGSPNRPYLAKQYLQ